MFLQFFSSMQQDIKLFLFFPLLCAVFRTIFIIVHNPYKSLKGKGKIIWHCYRYGFWWGMDPNAYIFLISLIFVTLPVTFLGISETLGNSIRIGIGIVYALVLYAAFAGKMIFYYHFHDICEIIEWICKNTLLEKCDVEEKTPDCWIYTLFENAHADRNFYRKVIQEFGRELLEKAVITDVEERMKRMLSVYKIEENEVLTFLTTSLLNYVIIVAET